jgi:hypothetical protein
MTCSRLIDRAAVLACLCVAGCSSDSSAPSDGGLPDRSSTSSDGGLAEASAMPSEGGADGDQVVACSVDSQCQSDGPGPYACAPGGVYTGCGGPSPCVLQTPCNTDSDCHDAGSGDVCQTSACPCQSFAGLCAPACTGSGQCSAGETCQAGHCVATPCTTNADCVANFICDPTSLTCQLKTCQTDGECNGYCVDNVCASKPGVCVPGPV